MYFLGIFWIRSGVWIDVSDVGGGGGDGGVEEGGWVAEAAHQRTFAAADVEDLNSSGNRDVSELF